MKIFVTRLLIVCIKSYRYFFSPLTLPSCRFYPSCSEYAIQALAMHGATRGIYLTGARILRCNPFGKSGFDPVPHKYRPKKLIKKLNFFVAILKSQVLRNG